MGEVTFMIAAFILGMIILVLALALPIKSTIPKYETLQWGMVSFGVSIMAATATLLIKAVF